MIPVVVEVLLWAFAIIFTIWALYAVISTFLSIIEERDWLEAMHYGLPACLVLIAFAIFWYWVIWGLE